MMQAHLRELRLRWETDRKRNAPGVYMPQAIALKYPAASREWIWFWVFPARQPYTDKRTRCCAYWHMHPSRLQTVICNCESVFKKCFCAPLRTALPSLLEML
jgi:hypothetical protein